MLGTNIGLGTNYGVSWQVARFPHFLHTNSRALIGAPGKSKATWRSDIFRRNIFIQNSAPTVIRQRLDGAPVSKSRRTIPYG